MRTKGQFWTPAWLARAMAAWVVALRPPVLFDPAAGPGTFFAAARGLGFQGSFAGFELDGAVLAQASKAGLGPGDLRRVRIGDFLAGAVRSTYPAIISNPPYIRHHRLDRGRKRLLQARAARWLGFALDGRVGLHVYFLLKCLQSLSPDGRLAFLLPADVCEGVSSSRLWRRLSGRFRFDAVITFSREAAPFPDLDTNALVFLLSKRAPRPRIPWLRVLRPDADVLSSALAEPRPSAAGGLSVQVCERELEELISTGLSRPPRAHIARGAPLSAFAKVVRGIATGANEIFFLTSSQIRRHGLERRFFRRAIGRTRDCPAAVLRARDMAALDRAGRPTWLLSLDGAPKSLLPPPLRAYLVEAERAGLAARPLIATRRPWYRMEHRPTPALLFAYLGRRDCRFVLNEAGVVPLTCFLCVYPRDQDPRHVRRLWRALNDPATLANLPYVGKSYGGGAIKAEPRQLEALELPPEVIKEYGLAL
ncbi:MAG: Eco57I restriction-modification methylase domain-containing protein [Limisphaerales bacterium]